MDEIITLDYGSGGKKTARLIEELLLPAFSNPALEALGAEQMLITDPMSVYYLTDVFIQPFERFFGLLLRRSGEHVIFLNNLFCVPQELGIEKVWYSDTDSVPELIARYLDSAAPLAVDKELPARHLLPLMAWAKHNVRLFFTPRFSLWSPVPSLAVHCCSTSVPPDCGWISGQIPKADAAALLAAGEKYLREGRDAPTGD